MCLELEALRFSYEVLLYLGLPGFLVSIRDNLSEASGLKSIQVAEEPKPGRPEGCVGAKSRSEGSEGMLQTQAFWGLVDPICRTLPFKRWRSSPRRSRRRHMHPYMRRSFESAYSA